MADSGNRRFNFVYLVCLCCCVLLSIMCYTYRDSLQVIKMIKQTFDKQNYTVYLPSKNRKASSNNSDTFEESTTQVSVISSKVLSTLFMQKQNINQPFSSHVATDKVLTDLSTSPKTKYVKKKDTYINLNFQGRLGNLLFEFASLYGISRQLHLVPVVNQNLPLRKIFTFSNVPSISVINPKVYNEKKGCTFEKEALSLDNSFNWTLNGYFQSWKYFINYRKELQTILSFQRHIRQEADKQFNQILAAKNMGSVKEVTFVALHVRLGDMFHPGHMTRFGYKSSDVSYINRAMESFQSKFSNVLFVVSSDEISWCRNNLKKDNIAFISQKNPPEIDMAILTKCNHTIITTGSYGWWVAWLIGGNTIYDKTYPKAGSRLEKLLNSEDYRPASWLPM